MWKHHDATALNPRESPSAKVLIRFVPTRNYPPTSSSSSSYFPAVVSLRTLPPFVALSRPFWCTRKKDGRGRSREGAKGERRGWLGPTRGRTRENSPSIFLAGQQHRREPFFDARKGLGLLFLLASFVLLIIRLSDRRYSITSGGFREKTIKTRPVHESFAFFIVESNQRPMKNGKCLV